jgi:3-oxoacid CoA-transferase subunit A
LVLVHARLGGTHGNLVCEKAAIDFHPLAAMAGTITIAQVEELVSPADVAPGAVHLPGGCIQRIVCSGRQGTRIEKRTISVTAGAK